MKKHIRTHTHTPTVRDDIIAIVRTWHARAIAAGAASPPPLADVEQRALADLDAAGRRYNMASADRHGFTWLDVATATVVRMLRGLMPAGEEPAQKNGPAATEQIGARAAKQ